MRTEWTWRHLGEVAHVEMGQSPPSEHVSEISEAGLAFLQGNAEFSDLYPHPRLRCSKPLKKAKSGDALISVRAPVGAINRADQDYCIGRGLAAIRFIQADPDYGYHALAFVASNLLKVAQGTTFEAVGGKDLRGLEFPDSPAPEQRRIAEILDTLDEAIRKTEQVIAKLQQMKQGLLHDLLTRGIDENGELRDPERHPEQFKDSVLGRIPRGWRVCPLGDLLLRVEYGISTSLLDRGEIPVLRMMNFENGEAELSSLKYASLSDIGRLLLYGGDVLFNRTNSIDHVGRTGIWREQLPAVSFASYLVRLVPDEILLIGEFLNRWLNWELTQTLIRRWATPGVQQVNINPTNLQKTLISLPASTSEQQRLTTLLTRQDQAQDAQEAELQKLRTLKQGLMDDLLTGRVRVSQADSD